MLEKENLQLVCLVIFPAVNKICSDHLIDLHSMIAFLIYIFYNNITVTVNSDLFRTLIKITDNITDVDCVDTLVWII